MDDPEKTARLIEAAVALLEGAPGRRMQITNLNKALFYLDLAALRDTGETITHNDYVAMDKGPVVNEYKTLVKELAKRNLAHQDVVGLEQPVVLDEPLKTYRYLDDFARSLAAQVASFVASHSAAGVSDLSHRNPGWQMAFNKSRGRKRAPAPIDMYLAMQQLADKDPWLVEEPDQEFLDAVQSEDGKLEPWQ